MKKAVCLNSLMVISIDSITIVKMRVCMVLSIIRFMIIKHLV